MGVYNNNKDGTRSTLANTIQVVDASMEQFVSRGEFSAVTPSDVSADNKLVAENEVTKAVDTMPTASASLVGTIVQYVGTTTANYTNGYFYRCDLVDNNYVWVAISDLPPNGTTGQVLVKSSNADYDTEWGTVEGIVREKVYTPADITIIADHYIRRTSGTISGEYSGTSYFEVPVTSGEKYIVSTQHGYAMAAYALYNSDGGLVSAYPTSDVDIIVESVEVTIPQGVTMMRGSGYNTVPLKVFKITDGGYTIDTTANDILHGKKWVVCGDSFTVGTVSSYTDSEGHTGYESDGYDPIQGKLKNYSYFIANRTGINVTLLARSGSDFTNVEGASVPFSNENSAKNYTQIPSDADYITLAYGLNETTLTTEQIGTKEDTTNETLWGAYNVVLTSILTANPSVKIGIIINDAWMTKPYHDALIEIAENWGIPYLDMKDSVEVPIMIDGRFYDEVNDTAKALRNSAFKIADNAHPTPKAQEYRSTVIENFLRSL